MNRMTKSLVVPVSSYWRRCSWWAGSLLLPPLDNPFREKTVDRTGPSALYSLRS